MKTIKLWCCAILVLCITGVSYAQTENTAEDNKNKIKYLIEYRNTIEDQQKEYLKREIEAIEKQVTDKEITATEAQKLKEEVATKRAQIIVDKKAIVDLEIKLLKSDPDYRSLLYTEITEDEMIVRGKTVFSFSSKNKTIKYDKRTTVDPFFSIGFQNTRADGRDLLDTPYGKTNSGFIEFGLMWKTRILKESNFWRFRYGFSFLGTNYNPRGDGLHVDTGSGTEIQESPVNLKKSELNIGYVSLPLFIEFGPSSKREKKTYFRYSTRGQWRFGVGGYLNYRLGARQVIRFSENGEDVRVGTERDYNTTDLSGGVSAYIGKGNWSIIAKQDVSPLFRLNGVKEYPFSLGIRYDLQ